MTDTYPAVAVLMPCRNYGEYLEEAVRSVAAQTVPVVELVLIDDASTDNTPAVIERLSRELHDLPMTTIRHQEQQGFVSSLQEGIARSKAPLIAHVDADDRVLPRYVESLCAALEADQRAGYAYPRMRLFGSETGVFRSGEFNAARLVYEGNYIPHIGIMRRTAYERSRGYRDLPTHVDWDLWLSFLDKGIPGVFVNEVLYEWRRHPRSMTLQSSRVRLGARFRVLAAHPRLLIRYLLPGLPHFAYAIWRRLRLAMPAPEKAPFRRTDSCWIEVDGSGEGRVHR